MFKKTALFFGVLLSLLSFVVKPAWALEKIYCNNSQTSANPKVNTALGCVPVKFDEFVQWLLPYFFGIAGGISFLLMIYGFFQLTTSGGDPKIVQGAKETITSAIIGLLVSIFSLFLLRLIVVDILKIPGIN